VFLSSNHYQTILQMKFIPILFALVAFLTACTPEQKQTPPTLPYFHTPDFTPVWIADRAALDTLHTLAEFSFLNQNGQRITSATFKGKIHVANYFFTFCPSLCPKIMGNMKQVQESFKNTPDVLIASYTVIPERDSVPALRAYADLRGVLDDRWHLITGPQKQLYEIARQSYFADENIGIQRGENDFLHTENFILVDKNLHIRGIYNGTLPLEITQLVEDIKTLQKER
jgi:protein SCO1